MICELKCNLVHFEQLNGEFDIFIVKVDKITYTGLVKPRIEIINISNQTIR
jgi:hypothetical protein